MIWEMFEPKDLYNIALVSKMWKEFSEPFILQSLGGALLQNSMFSRTKQLNYEIMEWKKKKNVEKTTQFTLRTAVVRDRSDFIEKEASVLAECDAIAFVFDSKGKIFFSLFFLKYYEIIKKFFYF